MFKLRYYVPVVFIVLFAGCVSGGTTTSTPSTTTPTRNLILPTPNSSPINTLSFPSDNEYRLIAYSSDQDGDFEILMINKHATPYAAHMLYCALRAVTRTVYRYLCDVKGYGRKTYCTLSHW